MNTPAFLGHALRCGAPLLDVMGDQFDPSPLQITYSPAAAEKQKALIGPMLGCCMWLCVVEYTSSCTPTQPLLRAVSR